MLPFRVELEPGLSPFRQVVYAAKRAMIAGDLPPGASFPSVRRLSRELRINPNTAHKVVAELRAEGLLEVLPGVGTVVARGNAPSARDRARLLGDALERLVVEAKHLGLELGRVQAELGVHWERLSSPGAGETSAEEAVERDPAWVETRRTGS